MFDKRIIKKSGLFDPKYYLTQYPDVRNIDVDPLKHFCKYGWKEGRNPSSSFETTFYLENYKDIKEANINPLVHYILNGQKEGRKINKQNADYLLEYNCIKKSIFFDKDYYIKRYPNISTLDPIEDYIKYGWKEGRNPSQKFNTNFYLDTYSDIKNTNINPLYHYIKFGQYEERKISNKFNWESVSLNSTQNVNAINQLTKRRFEFLNNNYNAKKYQNELPDIDISVVTYNSERWIDKFIKSILKQNYNLKKINLYFIDNSSTDNTIQILEEYKNNKLNNIFNSITLISQSNLGFGAGHDRTFKEGKSEFCLVSNIDLEFEKHSILSAVKIALSDEKEEYASWEFRQIPFEHPKYYDPITLETNWSSHACILIRKSAYLEVGGYEPKIFMYAEDVELSYRFRAYGYHLKYCPDSIVYHYTYDDINKIKPIQFEGSILGNAYLRLRYGNRKDKLSIFRLFNKLLNEKEIFPGSKKLVNKNILKIFDNKEYFLKSMKRNNSFYAPFRGFDYEMIRDGGFYEVNLPNNKPLVSIVVRTYKKRDALLKQALISISNQTYKNIEVIVVEDGGNTMQKLVSEMHNLLNIKYFALDKVERSVTGNYGLSQATGEYCIFLDDDDLFFADHIEVLVQALDKNPIASASYSLSFQVPTTFLDEDKKTYFEENIATPEIFYQEFDYSVLEHHNYFPIQSVLFKRNLFLERGGFDESLVHLEDWNLWLRYAYKNHFIYVPKTTSLYRVPADKLIAEKRAKVMNKAYDEAKEKAKRMIKELNI